MDGGVVEYANMEGFVCKRCGSALASKHSLERHLARLRPCKPPCGFRQSAAESVPSLDKIEQMQKKDKAPRDALLGQKPNRQIEQMQKKDKALLDAILDPKPSRSRRKNS